MDYATLLARKLAIVPPSGISDDIEMPDYLFDFQKALTSWAIRRGSAAIFADTGLGKTRIELAWGSAVCTYTNKPILIISPLAVAAQTAREGQRIGVHVTVCREAYDVQDGINITNYERMHKFDATAFGGVVLDESSIIKHHDARTFVMLVDMFRQTPFKLAATATPAPNDWTELGTHAEFLGICSRAEMLSEFFIHDSAQTSVWRLKGHARAAFWRWVSSWGAMVRKPSDLGFDDSLYDLPPLQVTEHITSTEIPLNGMLFPMPAQTLTERRQARRLSLDDRVNLCADTVNSNSKAWVVWCDLNDESKALTSSIPGAIEITGSDDADIKERRLEAFANGEYRVLVSKPSICGWGLNWQHASHMAFVGVTDSYEAYYQAIRRCWRFGQSSPVNVHIFSSTAEGNVIENLKRKERDSIAMAESLSTETRESVMESVLGFKRSTNAYVAHKPVKIPTFLEIA